MCPGGCAGGVGGRGEPEVGARRAEGLFVSLSVHTQYHASIAGKVGTQADSMNCTEVKMLRS